MLGLMQSRPLLVSGILTHAARHHRTGEVVSRDADGSVSRHTYPQIAERARRLARALQAMGIQPGDRVATLAWNSHRHLELYYAVSGMGAVIHTVNPRLAPPDIAHILNDAGSVALFADPGFAPLVEGVAGHLSHIRTVALLASEADMPAVALAPGQDLLCYETLLADASDDYEWPEFPEETASALCYTSGTTGRAQGGAV